MIDTTNTDYKSKSFWSRKEGKTGMGFIALLAIGGYFALPFVTGAINSLSGLLANLTTLSFKVITLGIYGLLAYMIYFIATDPTVRSLVKFGFKNLMRKITEVFVEIDPIGIMKSYIEILIEKKAIFDEKREKMSGTLKAFSSQIDKNERDAQHAMELAQQAKKQNQQRDMILNANEATRLRESNEKMKPTLATLTSLYERLGKVGEVCDFTIRDLDSEVRVKSQERKIMLAGYSMISDAKKILAGGDSDRELFDRAMEYTVNDYETKMGTIDGFLQSTETVMNGIDLQTGIWQEKALKALADMDAKSAKLIGIDSQPALLEMGVNHVGANVPAGGSYGQFFKQ
jgi:hypothetical protein